MISDDQVRAYRRDGVIVVPSLLDAETLAHLRGIVAELVAGAAAVAEHNEVYDLEPGHTPEAPRVRRIKAAHKVHPAFDALVRSPPVLDILTRLIGPGLRLHGSKLNMKSAQYGSPVEWHQDWAFYPHTNDDLLAIGVLLDDTDHSNGPMLVSPGTHRGPVWSHHGDDGRFIGLIDPDLIRDEIARAIPCVGPAGSLSFHHVRALHGSGPNTFGPLAQPLAVRGRGERRVAVDGGQGFRRVRQPAHGRALDRDATHDGDAGADSAAAAAQARFDLRDAIGRAEVVLHPSGVKVASVNGERIL